MTDFKVTGLATGSFFELRFTWSVVSGPIKPGGITQHVATVNVVLLVVTACKE